VVGEGRLKNLRVSGCSVPDVEQKGNILFVG